MYYLSELGQQLLASNSRELSLYERRLLRHVAQGQSPEEIRAFVGVGDVGETLYVLAKNGFLSKDPPVGTKTAAAPTVTALRNGLADVLKEVSAVISKTAAEISTLPPIFTSAEKSAPLPESNTKQQSPPAPAPAAKPVLVLASNNEAPKALAPTTVVATIAQLHPELRRQITAVIQETGALHLGLFSRDIIALCENAKTMDTLQVGISRWHIALLDSKTGKDLALDYLQQIKTLLNTDYSAQAISA